MRAREPAEDTPRGRVLRCVRENPGAYFGQIQRATGLAQGELAYHLRVLERDEAVVALAAGRYKHFFVRNAFPPSQKVLLSVLALRPPREILLLIAHEPGITATAIAHALRTTPPNVAWHLRRLKAAGLVHGERAGGSVHYRALVEPGTMRRFLELYHPSVWQVWSERLAETWSKMATR